MPPVVPASQPVAVLTERHIRILDAAERVFARAGFHAATMQDVAAEAGMSPGNLYRYFSSKDAIIEGMTERDHSLIAEDFGKLCPQNGSLLDQLEALGRKHLVDQPREKAVRKNGPERVGHARSMARRAGRRAPGPGAALAGG